MFVSCLREKQWISTLIALVDYRLFFIFPLFLRLSARPRTDVSVLFEQRGQINLATTKQLAAVHDGGGPA